LRTLKAQALMQDISYNKNVEWSFRSFPFRLRCRHSVNMILTLFEVGLDTRKPSIKVLRHEPRLMDTKKGLTDPKTLYYTAYTGIIFAFRILSNVRR